MKLSTSGILSILALFLTFGCSSSATISSGSAETTSSIFPKWYQTSEFMSDSISYVGYATAIASDSLTAIKRADTQARAHLESNIAQLTENIRTDIKDAGSTNVSNADFIILLRSAHAKVEGAASLVQKSAKKEGTYYRAFASVDISKENVTQVLESGFNGHPRYWSEFSTSESFKNTFNK